MIKSVMIKNTNHIREQITQLLHEVNPLGIALPPDEYDIEASAIINKISTYRSLPEKAELAQMISDVFESYLEYSYSPTVTLPIAQRILEFYEQA